MYKDKIVWLLCGIPGSGKSTWVNNKLKELKPDTAIIISRDQIRFSLLSNEDNYFAQEQKVWSLFVKKIQTCINDPTIQHIFVDATNLNKRSRLKVFQALNLKEAKRGCIIFDVPFDTCIKRNAQRDGRAFVPPDVIKSMSDRLHWPDKYEKMDYIIKVNEQGEEFHYKVNFKWEGDDQ